MKDKVQPKTLSGFMELLPAEQILFNKIKDTIKCEYEKYGFIPLDTPVLENAEVLLAKAGGETEKQIYSFNKGDTNLCMRFDLTVPLAKYVAGNYSNLNFPFRRYQISKVYRGERPQKGRFREFYQCDIDIVGENSLNIVNDAEVPSVIYNIFKKLDVGEFYFAISNRKLLLGLIQSLELETTSTDILRLIDKYDKIGEENVRLSLVEDYKLPVNKIDALMQFLKIDGTNAEQLQKLKDLQINSQFFEQGILELTNVVMYMEKFGIEEKNIVINLKIARGLDYYTGTVYETFIRGSENMGSVSSGGRYDNLAEFYTDKKLPGVGMSIGLTRLYYQLREKNLIVPTSKTTSKVIVLPMGNTLDYCIQVVNKLREANISAEIYLEDTKFKNKLTFASEQNINYTIIVGEDELATNVVAIKNMQKREQTIVNFANLLDYFK